MAEVRSWVVWVKGLTGLTPTEMLVATELSRLADWRGEVIASVGHLASATGRSSRSVKRALAGLERRRLVERCRRRVEGRQAASRIRLLPTAQPSRTARLPGGEVYVYRFVLPEVDTDGPWVDAGDDQGLREAILAAEDAGWQDAAAVGVVFRSLEREVSRQMGKIVAAGRRFAGLSLEESKWDTVSWAWEVLRVSTAAIAAARSPWAMWTEVTRRATIEGRDVAIPEGVLVEAWDPALLSEATGCGLPGDVEKVGLVGLDDFDGVLTSVVDALREAGMAEAVAWSGTRRVVELALQGASRRHTAAAHDPRLADLGASPECARAWMTMLVGTRSGSRLPATDVGSAELAERAREVVRSLG